MDGSSGLTWRSKRLKVNGHVSKSRPSTFILLDFKFWTGRFGLDSFTKKITRMLYRNTKMFKLDWKRWFESNYMECKYIRTTGEFTVSSSFFLNKFMYLSRAKADANILFSVSLRVIEVMSVYVHFGKFWNTYCCK